MNGGQTDQLFEGILESAKIEAANILERSERDAKAVEVTYARKIEQALEQERRLTEQRLAQIRRHEESAIRNLQRHHEVSYGQRLRQVIDELVVQRMAALLQTDDYRKTLVGWIAEATIGLDRSEAIVNYSFRERVDEVMLREAERMVATATGKHVTLRLGGATLTGQGIEVTSVDGKVAYNNQVSTRLIRNERKLKELMEGQPCQTG